jgi:hypothetical protein
MEIKTTKTAQNQSIGMEYIFQKKKEKRSKKKKESHLTCRQGEKSRLLCTKRIK